jgi:small ubiquitin-related modifier
MGQDGNIVQFKIKKHTALKKLMATYCERAGLALQVSALSFPTSRFSPQLNP